MRKITKQAISHFLSCKSFKSGNDEVRVNIDWCGLLLHGNLIAEKRGNEVIITDCSWQTTTTKERLNGLLSQLGHGRIYQSNYRWMIDFKGTIYTFDSNTQYIIVDHEGNLCFTKRS